MTRQTMLRRLQSVLFPWPRRDERQAAINQARRDRERSRRDAEHAARVETQIRSMVAQNHFAAAITEQILARHRGAC
jgi:hypothetical protein